MNAEKRIGIISDTHGLLRDSVVALLKDCDLIIHAGDVGEDEILEALRSITRVVAVKGNTDWGSSRKSFEYLEYEGKKIGVLHDLSDLPVDPEAMGLDMVVYGHSHRPLIERRGKIIYLNPGSAGPRRFKLPVSLAVARLTPDGILPEIIEID